MIQAPLLPTCRFENLQHVLASSSTVTVVLSKMCDCGHAIIVTFYENNHRMFASPLTMIDCIRQISSYLEAIFEFTNFQI